MILPPNIPTPKSHKSHIKLKIKGMDFYVEDISWNRVGNVNYNYFETRLITTTPTDNWMKLDKWFNNFKGRAADYKVDLNFNGVIIAGIFPIDYNFNQHDINVTFSVDYINGDLELLKLQQLRKEKLERINGLSKA